MGWKSPLRLSLIIQVKYIFYSRNTLFSVWKVNDKTVGYRKQVGLYELRTVNNAGHLVPMDQGPAARQLVKDFVSGGKSIEIQAQQKIENMDVVSNWSVKNQSKKWFVFDITFYHFKLSINQIFIKFKL